MYYTSDQLFHTAREFIEYFLWGKEFETGSKFDASSTGKAGVIFRGQSDSKWDLIPTAFRPNALEGFTPQPPYRHLDSGVMRSLGRHLLAEARAISLFLEAADSMGIPTPLDYTVTKEGIKIIIAALNDEDSYNYKEDFPRPSFERATALAQHYGVPTRFLDWSESPLVACYFAAIGASLFAKSAPYENQEIAVVYMDVWSVSKDDSPIAIVRAPRHENSNLLRQQGIFTNFRYANEYFIDHKKWPTLNEVALNAFPLYRARLPVCEANNLLKILFDLDISRHSLMPTLDNAAKAYNYAEGLFSESI
jgi:hypothetical protein